MKHFAWTLPFLIACGAGRYGDPSSALKAYAHALEEGRNDEAYRLLSDDAKRSISKEAFLRLAKEHPEEVREIGRALARPTTEPVVTAKVTSPSGQELELVLENGAWRIASTAVDFYAQDTPRHAVQGFIRALERKRYDVLLRFVPDSHRERLDAAKLQDAYEGPDKKAMTEVLDALKQSLPMLAIEQTGDHASFVYAAGTMTLVKEHGVWKIEDLD